MSESFLLGLDLGGSGLRCLLLSPDSGRVVTAARPWSSAPEPGVPFGSAYDAVATWSALAALAREALERAGATADRVLGLAATSVRHASALLDAEGRELLLAPNRDARGAPFALQLGLQRGAELHRRTGHWPNGVQPVGRLRWLASQAPETYARTATHLSLSDWIAFRLCGERATDPTQASETGLLEIARPVWDRELVESLELRPELLPEVLAPGSRLGGLSGSAAAALGLRAGTPVAVGAGDSQCALLAAGVVARGALGLVAGSSAPVLQVTDRPLLDPDARLWTSHHLLAGRWCLESNAGGVGEALEWLAGLLHPEAAHPLLLLLAEAQTAPPGSAGLLSSFGAHVMDARSMTLPVGNLTLNHLTTPGDRSARQNLSRSILEGMAFALRANAEQLEAITAEPGHPLRLTGGLSRSAFFTQLLTDVLGRRIEATAVSEASALGAALCAGAGAGVFAELSEGARALVALRAHEPDDGRRERYAGLHDVWQQVREARLASDAQVATLAMGALPVSESGETGREAGFRPHLLVTADLDEDGLAALREIGEVEHQSYRKAMRLLTGASLAEALHGVHVLVTEVDVVDAAALLDAPDLRLVAVCRGDAVNVDLEACSALGIPVVNTPGRNADAVADLTLAFLLMLARRLRQADAFLREPGGEAGDMGRMGRAFGLLRGRELWRKTVGLVGLGAVGRKVVERLRPFGARCLVHDPYLEPDRVRLAGAEPVELERLLRESDFVSLHAAVTEASRGLIGPRELALMKPGAGLVNTARAALLDEDALLEALRSGQLGGAALDVFAVEPPASDHPLLALDNVIATPHVGGNTQEVAAHQGALVAEALERLRRGERPDHVLNPATLEGYRWSQPRRKPDAELARRLRSRGAAAVTDLQKEKQVKQRKRETPTSAVAAAPVDPSAAPVRAAMERILRGFVERVVADERLAEFARSSADVTLHFTITDLGSHFHVGFRDGGVLGALQAPDGDADVVQLKMKADLLDGMLTGRRNAMQAAMNGELSFSGDTAKAMTLQQINADLSRLYRDVREASGDPGDLTVLSQPKQAASAAPTARTSSLPAEDIRHELCRIVDELYAAQLVTATGGNVSARIPDAPDQAWITPSQLFKGDLRPEILVRIGMDGKGLDEDARSPSSEALMHTAVLQAKAEAQAVIHCHAPHATVLVNSGLPFLPISTEAAFFQNIGRIPFIMPGTQELADAIVEAIGDGWAVLMQNHGLLVAGRTLRRAADMAEIIERTSQVILGCHAVGKEPPVLPAKVVKMLARYGDLMA